MNVQEALRHKNVLGAGAEKRRKLKTRREVFEAVMKEFHRGTLHSGSGEIVKNPKQAMVIALHEASKKS